MKTRKIAWTALLTSVASLFFLHAHSATRSEQGNADAGTHASEISGVWVQVVGQATRPNWTDSQGNRLEKLPLTAWGEERFKANRPTHGANAVASTTSTEPIVKCLPPGVPAIYMVSIYPMEIMQVPGRVIMFFEYGNYVRQIFTDGRTLPKDPQPSWLGYSVGKWDGDTFVVDTIGVNERTWLDNAGRPHSDAMHLTERYHRRDFGHLEVQLTIDDPKTYTKPWTVNESARLLPDTDLLEYVCSENNKDVPHLVGK